MNGLSMRSESARVAIKARWLGFALLVSIFVLRGLAPAIALGMSHHDQAMPSMVAMAADECHETASSAPDSHGDEDGSRACQIACDLGVAAALAAPSWPVGLQATAEARISLHRLNAGGAIPPADPPPRR